MAFTITLCTTYKRINSTSQKATELVKVDVIMKSRTSITNPIFILSADSSSTVTPTMIYKCNWVKALTPFHRYYWVDDIVAVGGQSGGGAKIFELYCHCDVLASFVDSFDNESHFVLYTGDITKADLRLDDERLVPELPIKGNILNCLDLNPLMSGVTWIVTIKTITSTGSFTTPWAMTSANFLNIFNVQPSVLSSQTWDEFVQKVTNLFGSMSSNPLDFIQDFYCVYINYSWFDGTEQTVTIGTGTGYGSIVGKQLTGPLVFSPLNYAKQVSVPSPVPTQNSPQLMHFLKGSKYTKLTLKSASGCVDISSDSFIEYNSLMMIQVKWLFDCTTGDWICEIWSTNTNEFLGSVTGNVSWHPYASLSGQSKQSIAAAGIQNAAGTLLKVGGAVAQGQAANLQNHAASLQGSPVLSDKTKANHQSRADNYSTNANAISSISTGIIGAFSTPAHSPMGGGGQFNSGFLGTKMSMMNLASPSFTDTSMARIMSNVCIPKVCESLTTYQTYGEEHGYPCSQILQLKTLANNTYLQCSKASVNSATLAEVGALPQEVAEINNFLNTGIFFDRSDGKGEVPKMKHLVDLAKEYEKADVAEKASE